MISLTLAFCKAPAKSWTEVTGMLSCAPASWLPRIVSRAASRAGLGFPRPSIRCIRSHISAGSALQVLLLARQRLKSHSRTATGSRCPERLHLRRLKLTGLPASKAGSVSSAYGRCPAHFPRPFSKKSLLADLDAPQIALGPHSQHSQSPVSERPDFLASDAELAALRTHPCFFFGEPSIVA